MSFESSGNQSIFVDPSQVVFAKAITKLDSIRAGSGETIRFAYGAFDEMELVTANSAETAKDELMKGIFARVVVIGPATPGMYEAG